MCGIAGIFRFDQQKVECSQIKKLTDAIMHRGPNGEGCWINKKGNVGLGHRRLSILDLTERASQPMHYADGQLTIVFNGEIFNFAELRKELKLNGYQFNSDSDTEVLLAAFHFWGKDCLYRFNGFWAFAIWDELTKELWLARDRFGIKPLHYLMQHGKQFIFGSETIQFNHINGFKKEADESLVSYNIQNSWGIEGFGKTIFKGIEQVKPGHFVTIDQLGEFKQTKWWDTSEHLVAIPSSYNEQVEVFKDLLYDSIKLRLRSDVSIASALSGGLDSSSVFAGIHEIIGRKENVYRQPEECLRAFVAVFPETEQDERIYADSVLDHVKGKATYVDCNYNSHILSKILSSIKSHDSISATPLFILDSLYAAMSEQNIIVSMDGHGVDEMMYGYPFNVLNAYGHQPKNSTYAKEIKNIYIKMLAPDEQRNFKRSMQLQNKIQRFAKIKVDNLAVKFLNKGQNGFWLNNRLTESLMFPEHTLPESLSGSEAQLYNDFHFTTLPTILRNFERAAMRNGVEIRMPFLDYRLVTYVFSLSMQSKLGNGFAKRILRDAMKDTLPEFVRTRTLKTGFNAPLKSWFQSELKEFILDEVSSTEFMNSNIWNGPLIKDFVLAKTKSANWTSEECFKLWSVLNAHLLFKN